MIRTQVSLSLWEYRLVKKTARQLGISLAELLRRSLRSVLPLQKQKPWMRYAGDISTGDPHSSQKIDSLIYGHKD